MKKLPICLISALLLIQNIAARAIPTPEPLPKYPDSAYEALPENYKELVQEYLSHKLFDPYSAHIEWLGKPIKSAFKSPIGWVPTWSIGMFVNAKNRFGAYVGEKMVFAEIKDGRVIGSLGLEGY